MSPEILDLLERIENWRRCYRTGQKLTAVPWYTPPKLGDVFIEVGTRNRIPIDVDDALLLEVAWRNITCEPKKFFIKQEFIVKMNRHAIRRMLRRYDVKLYNNIDYEAYSYASLSCFLESIGRHRGKALRYDKMA